jgi:hypothetical protein
LPSLHTPARHANLNHRIALALLGGKVYVPGTAGPGGTRVCSTDHYFPKEGAYRFDPALLRQAHDHCLRSYLDLVHPISAIGTLVVDNTNLAVWEVAPYYRLAEVHGHEVEVVHTWAPFEVCLARNTHQVPHHKMWRMWQTLLTERLPPHWHERIVNTR